MNNNTSNTSHEQFQDDDDHQKQKGISDDRYMPLLLINFTCLFVGSVSSSLISKYYFNHKGASKWVSTWVQSAGFPLLCFPIFLPYYLFRCTQRKPFTRFSPGLITLSMFIGLMLGLNNLLFSWGNAYLPVSTSALLLSSQLVFNLIMSVIMVKQKISFMNLNCVILLTLSSTLLAVGGSSGSHAPDEQVSRGKYLVGYMATIGAGLLFALYLPMMEKIYKKVNCYAMVMEMQLVMEIGATTLASMGIWWEGGFGDREKFDKGEGAYWATVMSEMVCWQMCFMGTAGMVYLTCSLTGGICMTALVGMNVLGGVLVFKEEFGGVKAVSTLMCAWGFCSYMYGMYVIKNNTMTAGNTKHLVNVRHQQDHHKHAVLVNINQQTAAAQSQPQPQPQPDQP